MSSPLVHLASLVEDFAGRGDEIAVVTIRGVRERHTSYQQLALLSRRFAHTLQLRGLNKGDRVLLWGDNCAEWVAAFFGCVLNGSLPVPVDTGSTPAFVDSLISDVAPNLVLADESRLTSLKAKVPALNLQSWPDYVPLETNFIVPDRFEADPLQIIFTSGTTGQPKGIVHTQRNVLASLRPIKAEVRKYLRYERPFHPIRILHTLPLSHVFGQFMGLWVPTLLGAEIHFQHRLVASEMVEYIRSRRISVLAAVPRVLDLLQAHLMQRFPDLSARLRGAESAKALARWWHFRDVHKELGFKFWAFVCGGASLSSGSERFWNGLGFVLIQGYGMTETTALVSLNHPFKLARGTVGQVLPGREVRLTPEGEVLVRGETISNVTWQNGELQQNESEWLSTGDLAEMDENGYLQFRGRIKDVIVTAAGLNIYPDDLEAALLRQGGVRACSVVESMDVHGPEPLAVLVTAPGSDPGAIVESANRELAEFQQLRRWLEWPEPDLPRTSTGKVLRREIARRISTGEVSQPLPLLLAGDLNLDSLGRVQLQAELESKFGVALNDAALQQVRTDADLQQLIRSAPFAKPKSDEAPEHAYPRWPWHPLMRVARSTFLELVALPLVRLLAKPKIHRRSNVKSAAPVLLVANHVTSYDLPIVLYALPRQLRHRVAVAMSGEMILDWRLGRRQGHWFLNWIAPLQSVVVTALFNNFPLPQNSGFRRSFRHAGEAIDAGYSVLIFPEGRRSDDGQLQPFKSGAGLLWQELDVPVLPIYLHGLGRIKAHGGRWFRTEDIEVRIGPILARPDQVSPAELSQVLQKAVADLEKQSTSYISG